MIFDQLIQNSPRTDLKINIDPNQDIAALQYTGGTTGTAKGAMLTHTNLLSNALAFATWIRATQTQDTFLTALPLFHIYGMTTSMTTPISQAAKMVLTPKFDPTKILETIQNQKVTVFCGVPTMYSALLAHPQLPKYNLTSIRVCISGASPLPPQVQKHFMKITGGFLAEGYGLTEASPVTHCTPVDKNKKTIKIGSIGLPLPDTDSKIVDIQTGAPLKQGETGELAVKGPQIMKGYWQKPRETKQVLQDGWLLTGDIAHMDNQGYFYITDRKKDLIKYKDYSVYPREIEDILYEHPKIKLCTVVGKPDAFVGEVPKAYIVLKEDAEVTEKQIKDFVNQKLAPYKAIREVEFRPDLPLSGAGKVLKRQLKDQ
jgi:long-chain acyl-CoA synthetase